MYQSNNVAFWSFTITSRYSYAQTISAWSRCCNVGQREREREIKRERERERKREREKERERERPTERWRDSHRVGLSIFLGFVKRFSKPHKYPRNDHLLALTTIDDIVANDWTTGGFGQSAYGKL